MTNTKALEVIKEKKAAVPSLQKMVDIEIANREILTNFIAHHMKKGVDYGPIHINSKCENKYNCVNKYHFSKDCLFKPGAEKFTSLMKLKSVYKKDSDTWEMAGSPAGMFCYVCELINSNGDIVGEGRGCATIAEKGSANTAIKIAEKRAKMDAVLSTGGLSDFFTQDLEDMYDDKQLDTEDAPLTPKQMRQDIEQRPSGLASDKQIKLIHDLLWQKHYSEKSLLEKYEVLKPADLTKDQASEIIEKLMKLPVSPIPAKKEKEEEITDEDMDNFEQARLVN